MKRYGFLAVMAAVLLVGANAFAICTCVNVTTASTKVLAANDQGSAGRHWLELQNGGGNNIMWCDVGNSAGATVNSGYIVGALEEEQVPSVIIAPRTFALAPNGEVDCITDVGQTRGCACDY